MTKCDTFFFELEADLAAVRIVSQPDRLCGHGLHWMGWSSYCKSSGRGADSQVCPVQYSVCLEALSRAGIPTDLSAAT